MILLYTAACEPTFILIRNPDRQEITSFMLSMSIAKVGKITSDFRLLYTYGLSSAILSSESMNFLSNMSYQHIEQVRNHRSEFGSNRLNIPYKHMYFSNLLGLILVSTGSCTPNGNATPSENATASKRNASPSLYMTAQLNCHQYFIHSSTAPFRSIRTHHSSLDTLPLASVRCPRAGSRPCPRP